MYPLEDLGQSFRFPGGFDAIHGLSHPSIRATRKLMASHVCWQGLKKTSRAMDQAMPSLQKSQNPTSYQSIDYLLSFPSRRFDCVNIDIVGPLVPSEGNCFLLTMVDVVVARDNSS